MTFPNPAQKLKKIHDTLNAMFADRVPAYTTLEMPGLKTHPCYPGFASEQLASYEVQILKYGINPKYIVPKLDETKMDANSIESMTMIVLYDTSSQRTGIGKL